MKSITQIAEDYIKSLEANLAKEYRDLPVTEVIAIRKFAQHLKGEAFEAEMQKRNNIKTKSAHIAMISQFAPTYSGGRYYTFQIACALVEAGFDVTLYCDNQPPFLKDFIDYKFPKLVIADLEELDIEADIYIGSPVLGSEIACELAIKYNRPVYSLIFDSLPLMKKYKDQFSADTKPAYWEKSVRLWKESNCKMIACSEMTRKSIAKWLGKKKSDTFVIYPAINSRVLMQIPPRDWERKNRIIFVSRLVAHKNLEHVVKAMKGISKDWELHVITDTGTSLFHELVDKYDLRDRVFLHKGISDKEKFKLMLGSKIMINASTFEGAGIWLEEAQACGLITVCYEWETLRELDRSKVCVRFAKYNNEEDLAIGLAAVTTNLSNNYYAIMRPKDFFFDDYMVQVLKDMFKPKTQVGVMMIALNEEKYIGASLKALIKSPYISKIAVVEGADRKFAHAATPEGLSTDLTQHEILEVMNNCDPENKVVYYRYGWADSKSELRNKCIGMLGKKPDWLLKVDADEVYKPEDLEKLAINMEKHPEASMLWFRHIHFWKQPDMVAVGGQWDARLPRCFRFADKTLRFREHHQPLVNREGVPVTELGQSLQIDDVFVYHYGAMKSDKEIQDKLKYYKDRDQHLNVTDTFTDWKPGMPTQWTHGGGTAMLFAGTHPEEIRELLNI